MKKKTILICGATGFIGKNLVYYFSKNKKYKVIAVYNKKQKFNIRNVSWVKGDLKNEKFVKKVTKNIDILIQAAATTSGYKDIISRPYIHVTDNAIMNSLILKHSYHNKIKKLVFFSCTVMLQSMEKAQSEKDYNISIPIYPNYFGVGWTKIFIEKQCEFYSKISETKFTVIRHSNIYGPYDKYDLEKSHFFGANITKVLNLNDDKLLIWGKGDEKRDLLYISDLVNFVEKALKNQTSKFEIFNCGYGKSYKVRDVIKKIIVHSGKKIKIKHDLTKKSLNTKVALNCNKARKLIGWKPLVSLDSGIRKTIAWYIKNAKV